MATLNERFTSKNIELRNRLVLPPITTNYGSPDGHVTPDIHRFYAMRSDHVGLTIVEATAVHESGRIVPNSLGLWKDDQIRGMTELVETIHEKGAAAVVQLNHAGPRCAPDKGLRQGFSPSGIASRPGVDPIVMVKDDILKLVDDFSSAASRAKKAGFDGVEIHGAHLYLLSQFISPLTNKRTDEYGGDINGRSRLAADIVRNVRDRLGADYPIFFRINAEERIDGGLSFQECLAAARVLADAGVDIFDISLIAFGGFKEVDGKTILVGSSTLPEEKVSGANTAFTAAFKQEIGTPVIVVGKFGAGPAAGHAVEKMGIDLVAVGRQMICDPETAGKMLKGNDKDIIPCDECLACFASIGKGRPMMCKVNKHLPL